MKALPLWQPWATLVACGAKTIETRSWSAARYRLIGERIAIYATKGGLSKRDLSYTCARQPFRDALERAGIQWSDQLPRGRVLCTVVVARCTPITVDKAALLLRDFPDEHAFGNYAEGRFAWVLEELRVVRDPAPAKAHQGVFEWDPNPVAA